MTIAGAAAAVAVKQKVATLAWSSAVSALRDRCVKFYRTLTLLHNNRNEAIGEAMRRVSIELPIIPGCENWKGISPSMRKLLDFGLC